MIKILHINAAYGRGGAALFMSNLCESLNKQGGFRADMLVGINHSTDLAPNVRSLMTRGGYYLNVLTARLTGLDSIWYPFDHSRNIKKLIADYDIINLHNLHGYYFQLKYLDLLKDKKVVLSLHDFWPITGRCCSPIGCVRWEKGCGQCPHLDYYPQALLDLSAINFKLKRAAISGLKDLHIVSNSNTVDRVIKRAELGPKDSQVIRLGVNSTVFDIAPDNHGLIDSAYLGKRKILIIATKISTVGKGFKIFAKSLTFMPDREKEKYHLIIVGEKRRGIIEQLFPGFSFTSFGYVTDQREMARIYSMADLCVQPSLSESFGLVTVESMLCGTPVVAFKYDIMEEIIGEKRLLAEMRGDLAEALYLKIKEYFEKMMYLPEFAGPKIRQRGLIFSIDKTINDYVFLYKRL